MTHDTERSCHELNIGNEPRKDRDGIGHRFDGFHSVHGYDPPATVISVRSYLVPSSLRWFIPKNTTITGRSYGRCGLDYQFYVYSLTQLTV
jgi:hypothetical protein